jgi:hypothetical protein
MHLSPSPSPGRRGKARANIFNLFAQSLYVSRDHFLLPSVCIEVAIGAAMGTERDMEIKG